MNPTDSTSGWILPLATLLAGCPSSASFPAPRDSLEVVLPGTVSTAEPEFAFTISADGAEIYFNRASADRTRLVIMTARRIGGRWSVAAPAPFSGQYRDVDPYLAPDGRRLYFSSDRPRPSSTVRSFGTWYVERTAAGWTEPIDPGSPVNSDSTDVFVSVSREGEVFFSSRRDGQGRIWSTRSIGGRWDEPRPVDLPGGSGGNPMVSPSGRYLVFVREGQGTGADLWGACRVGNAWRAPVPLTRINSRWADFAPSFDPAETTLYFTSERPGVVGVQPDSVRPPGDIYRVGWEPLAPRCD